MSLRPPALDRRTLLQSAASVAFLAVVPRVALAAPAPASAFRTTIDGFAEQILALSPETATSLGLDKGARAPLKSQLSDISPASNARWTEQVKAMKQALGRIDPATLDAADRLRYETIGYAADRGIDGLAFPYGAGGAASGFQGGATPYIVSQQNGAVSSVPEFLDSQHLIATREDCDAYVARVAGFARQIDQETAQIKADAARGVMPPIFIAKTTLGQLKGFRATPASEQRLVSSLATRAQKAGVAGDWAARCTKLLETQVYPALDRQIEAFAAATARAPDTAGVQRLPDGDAYYHWALRLGTTTTMSAEEIHRTGLAQNEELKGRMDALLKQQGLTKGTVGERTQALNKDPRFLYPDTDAGRAEIIAYLNGRIAAIRPLLPQLSHLGLKADVIVKRVPPDIQDGAALGYMNFASLDGSRPAIYYVNLKTTALWPKYQLATLTAHEGIPGHTWQGAYLAEHHAEIPLITSLMGFNAFIEGWALYAEQLVAEHGLYKDDPFGEIGYLQAQQFRACRLVADTGLHAQGWSRQQTVQFLMKETGRGVEAMTSETDRYCASPGQACGYKVGHNEIIRLREKAKAALGAKFDLAAYDDAVVKTGGVPLTILERAIDAFIAG
ncbi:DUF885 domain-containing protein [Flavisphingomonas formosensis]|uniref:DUF885 domain-containing protein n=1 Tax=Flavisphingomonas formosensis TaxID=861534 RepID=UPI0012FA51B3|nr:DUF885 family protein [Sphingomonas formosensis]